MSDIVLTGDYLPGTIIGKALEAKTDDGQSVIEVAVGKV